MKSPLPSRNSAAFQVAIPLADIRRFLNGWIVECRYRQLSPATIGSRHGIVSKLIWWMEKENYDTCGRMEVQQFLTYVAEGHTEPKGRWDNPNEKCQNRPSTVATFHDRLFSFFIWLVKEGYVEASPMENLPPPVVRQDSVQPFTEDQVQALLAAARRSKYPERDEAILLFLLDTGVRASELCGLKMSDVDILGKKANVLGKGNKHRPVFFSHPTARALNAYLRRSTREPDDPLFMSEKKCPLTRSGLLQLVERLGWQAGIEATRCSPHTFRHTAAIWFLRNGGNVFSLQQMLGHEDLGMTRRYLAIAEADIQGQHIQFSPVERLKRGGRK